MVDEADSVSDSLSMENTAKTISTPMKEKKKHKKKKKKGKPIKESSNEHISEKEPASDQPSTETDDRKYTFDRNSRNDSPGLTSVCTSQMHDFSDDPSVTSRKECPEPSCDEISDLNRNLILTEVGTCNNNQISPCCKLNRSNEGTKGMSHINSQVCKVHPVTTAEEINCKGLTFEHDEKHAAKATSHQPSRANGKENRNFIWKKRPDNGRGAKNHGATRSNFICAERDRNFLEKNFAVRHNSFTSEGVLPTPVCFSYGHNNTGYRVKKVGNKEQDMNRRIHDKAFVEPSHSDSFLDLFEPHHFEKSNSIRTSIYNKQRAVSQATSREQQNVAPSSKLIPPGCSMFNGFQPYNWMRIPRVDHAFDRSSHSSSGSETSSDFRLHNFRRGFYPGIWEKKSNPVWVPVAARESSVPKRTNSSSGVCGDLDDKGPTSRQAESKGHLDANIAPLSVSSPLLTSESECLKPCLKMTSVESENSNLERSSAKIGGQAVGSASDCAECINKRNDTQQILTGLPKTVEALNAAYKLQLASQSFQLAVGCPIADFERLLHSAAPVISPSFECEKCTVCSSGRLFHDRLCKHQIPNTSIRSIWNWYEKPGNYGLEVRSEVTNSVSFHAYFVPSLSAIQLFYPRWSNENRELVDPELQEKRELESNSSSPKRLFAAHSSEAIIRPSHLQAECTSLVDDLYLSEPAGSLNETSTCIHRYPSRMNSSPACSSDAELVFEFFESEQPQQRKPLHNKVLELIHAETVNDQFFGDPSKLECSNLRDLHPASWFSVAWYPIYRIPEGKFRASFLTYHSLGFLTQRCIQTDTLGNNTYSVICPALGLESYNTQGECWFSPKTPVGDNSAEILRERLRTLEENAALFAKGCVVKGNTKVLNLQPDYEFFVSRKR